MSKRTKPCAALVAAMLLACFGLGTQALAQSGKARAAGNSAGPSMNRSGSQSRPCTAVSTDPTTTLTLGKSRVLRLNAPAARIVVGGQPTSRASIPVPIENAAGAAAARTQAAGHAQSDGVADAEITLLSSTELFILGRRPGSMNVVVQSIDGRCTVKDIVVTVDPSTLQAQLHEVLPEEKGVRVVGADSSLVLTGRVSDAASLQNVLAIANSYVDAKRVVNLLRVDAPQQVMLEVKIAEVSKTLLDRFGLDFSRIVTSANGMATSVISGIIGGGAGVLGRFSPNIAGGAVSGVGSGSIGFGGGAAGASVATQGRGGTLLGIDAQKKDGIVRVLAEPTIVAISGQAASFLSGGKIFIPVAQTQNNGFATITLEEKEFGVGLKFTPTVLDGRVNLKVVSEVSELSQTGSPFSTVGGQTAILPSMSTRRVDTTVQLGDGQSFAVAGLIKNNVAEALDKFPGLGEAPVLGALFRSSEFQNNQTELMFVVTPHLVKPIATAVALPTDVHVTPGRADVMLMGRGEGSRPPVGGPEVAPAPAATAPAPAPASEQPAVPPVNAPAAPEPRSEAEPAPVKASQVEPATLAANVAALAPADGAAASESPAP